MSISYKISANKNSKESAEDIILKQGLRDFNHSIFGESGSHFRIVATDNSEVIGGLIIEKCSDAFFIKTLWVSESHRKAGIASKLIEMLTEKALSDKIHNIFTDTYGFQAQGFYEKQGFKVISTIFKKGTAMKDFKQNIVSIYGDEGEQWLDDLPKITSKIAKEHNLSGLSPIDNMTFNYVASGYQNDTPIILKIGMNSKALAKEASCLKAFALASVAKVLANDNNMIIMERSVPGATLKEYFPAKDIEATTIFCSVLNELRSADIQDKHDFYHVKDLLKTLDNKLDIPDEFLGKAKHLRDELLSTTTKEVLLHGDLHHDNILKNGDSWLAIDPKGFIGDPAFEPAAYLCNPIPELLQENKPREIIENRINICSAELGIDSRRIADWLYVKSVLCWAWSLEDNLDHGYWEGFLEKISKKSS